MWDGEETPTASRFEQIHTRLEREMLATGVGAETAGAAEQDQGTGWERRTAVSTWTATDMAKV